MTIWYSVLRVALVNLQALTLIDRLQPENNHEMTVSAAPIIFGAALTH
jgi:hypothetical protein